MESGEAPPQDKQPTPVQTFLIADIRGYSSYTQERGDEAAARLSATFASISTAVVDSQGGKVLEFRGDEALAVFGSPRQALRAAADLHDRVAEDSGSEVGRFSIGIGIDAGEAVALDAGFRGGALNTAARLCSLARPGETLCTEVVKHLARKIDGLAYIDLGEEQLKGISEPVRIVEVQREGGQIVPVAPLPLRRREQPAAAPFEDFAFGNDLGQAISDRVHAALASRLGDVTDLVAGSRERLPRRTRGVGAPPRLNLTADSSTRQLLLVAILVAGVIVLALITAIVLIILNL
jgi:class 3 adenylate cyclase